MNTSYGEHKSHHSNYYCLLATRCTLKLISSAIKSSAIPLYSTFHFLRLMLKSALASKRLSLLSTTSATKEMLLVVSRRVRLPEMFSLPSSAGVTPVISNLAVGYLSTQRNRQISGGPPVYHCTQDQ